MPFNKTGTPKDSKRLSIIDFETIEKTAEKLKQDKKSEPKTKEDKK